MHIYTIHTDLSCAGEQLESVHVERQRAQAAYDLISYYNQFAREDTTKLDALKKEGREGRRQVGIILRRLSTVAKEVDLPSAEKVCLTYIDFLAHSFDIQTQERINKYCEKFEKDMLYLFDRCYRKGDPKMMHVRHYSGQFIERNTHLYTALRANSLGLQRWCFVCAGLRQSARFLH